MNLIKHGYNDKELILGYKDTVKELVPINFSLPDDIITEIYNNSRIYDKLTLCKLNKTFNKLCKHDQNINTYQFNLHQRITKDKSDSYIYAIYDNKLFLINRHMPEILLPKDIVPISIAATQKSIIILTKDGDLYGNGSNMYGELGHSGKKYDEVFKMSKPPGDILQVYCKQYQTVVLTTEGIFTYGNEKKELRNNSYVKILDKKDIYLIYPYALDNVYKFATPEGFFIMEGKRIKKINIDGMNDIIIIYMVYVLTTTGLYKVNTGGKSLKIEKIDIDNIKKISMGDHLIVLTYENEIYKQKFFESGFKKLSHKNVYDMQGDGVLITNNGIKVVKDMSNYFG